MFIDHFIFICRKQPDSYLGFWIDKSFSDKFIVTIKSGYNIPGFYRLFRLRDLISKYPRVTIFYAQPNPFLQNNRNHNTKLAEPYQFSRDNLSQNSSWQNN